MRNFVLIPVLFALAACGQSGPKGDDAVGSTSTMTKQEARSLCERIAASKECVISAWGTTTAGEIAREWGRRGVALEPWADVPADTPVADCSVAMSNEASATTVQCGGGAIYVDDVVQYYADRDGNVSEEPRDPEPARPCANP